MSKKQWDEMTSLWLAGRYRGPESPTNEVPPPWEFLGIFDSRAKAVQACKQDIDFVAPVKLNECAPDELSTFERAYYPLREAEQAR